MNTLYYCYNPRIFFHKKMSEKGSSVFSYFRKMPVGLRFIRNIYYRNNFPFKHFCLNIPDNINDFDMIIVPDDCSIDFPQFLENKIVNKNTKLIFYYWNPLNDKPLRTLSEKWQIWSFDKTDCMKFGIKYNPAPYFKTNIELREMKYDAVFVGLDKGRKNTLDELHNALTTMGLKPYFKTIDSRKNLLAYDEILQINAKSKSIVEILQQGQSGLTLRTMESIFYDKKLITNNLSIKNYSFYDKNNIFIIGYDNFENICDFINKPYKKLDENIKEQYTFDLWLERFEKNIELID